MKILTITTLFPNSEMPQHGIFIETRMKKLIEKYPNAEVDIVAPVPWFPFRHHRFGRYSQYAKIAQYEQRNGFHVYHPRYLVIPKIGMYVTPFFLLLSLIILFIKQNVKQNYQLIDGHYYYPDGVAIAILARLFNIPFTMTARGTDINLLPSYTLAKKMIQYVIKRAKQNLAVCQALSQTINRLSAVPHSTSITVRNGVDLQLFSFCDHEKQQQLRAQYGIPKNQKVAVSVGWLIERKGQYLTLQALQRHEDLYLYLIGEGAMRNALYEQAHDLGIANRVHFIGSVSQQELAQWFGIADISILASSREGWANVLLESMACGTPVVATNIWGTPEIITHQEVGQLVERTPSAIAKGITALLDNPPIRKQVRQHAQQFSWDESCDQLYVIFHNIIHQQQKDQHHA